MERINQFEFVELGQKLARLREAPEQGDVDAESIFFPLLDARGAVSQLLDGKPLELSVSSVCAQTLHKRLDDMIEKNYREAADGGGRKWKFPTSDTPPIDGWVYSQVRKALDEFETIFREEMREAAVYRVPRKGIFDTARLIDAADQTFPAPLLPAIPAKTRDDWCAAGRCLAFNLLSASGFHVARAVEGTLEAYYQAATGKQKTLNGWNDYIKALEIAAQNPTQNLVPTDKVIAGLQQMKGDYRNPIMHPRVVLNEADARMLFANGEALITAMAQEIQATQAVPTSGVLGAIAGLLLPTGQNP